MFHVLYLSSAVREFSEDELLAMLEDSRRRNAVHGITGALYFQGGHFLQCVEGAEEAVRHLYRNIYQDRRHRVIETLAMEEIPTRAFADWTMVFRNLNRESGRRIPEGYQGLMNWRGTTEQIEAYGKKARAFFRADATAFGQPPVRRSPPAARAV